VVAVNVYGNLDQRPELLLAERIMLLRPFDCSIWSAAKGFAATSPSSNASAKTFRATAAARG
jgi:hypothetical protein